ncbi:hypothetical protein Peur_000194 [Populus x canadensis]
MSQKDASNIEKKAKSERKIGLTYTEDHHHLFHAKSLRLFKEMLKHKGRFLCFFLTCVAVLLVQSSLIQSVYLQSFCYPPPSVLLAVDDPTKNREINK